MAHTIVEIEDLARRLCYEHEQANVWPAIDESERLHWRRQAQQKLTAEMHRGGQPHSANCLPARTDHPSS